MIIRYRARVEDSAGNRWSIATTTAAQAVSVATEQHAEIVWLKRIESYEI